MANDYIPRPDASFRSWAETFARTLVAKPSAYMIAPAAAASIQQAVDDFVLALELSAAPSTRTLGTINGKQNARHLVETLCRQYAQQIKGNLGIGDDDKINVGVRPINPARTPIGCPTTWPVLNLLGCTPAGHVMKWMDCVSEKATLPFGATGLELFVALGDRKKMPFAEARFLRKYTERTIVVPYEQPDDGKIATYYARWTSRRGEFGRHSLPVSFRVAA